MKDKTRVENIDQLTNHKRRAMAFLINYIKK